MRKKWLVASIIVICTILFIIINMSRMNKSELVNMKATQEGVIEETIFASGKLNPTAETIQYIRNNGSIKQMDIRLGDQVKVGQDLLIMDTKQSVDQLILEENNKQMIMIERDIFKKQKLSSAKAQLQDGVQAQTIIDPKEMELYELRLEAADLSIAALKADIAANSLKATVDGVVTEVHVKEGQTVAQGTPAFTIVDQSLLRVKAYLNELDVSKVNVGMDAKITGDAFEDIYMGKVSYMAPVAIPADASSRDVAVEIWVDLATSDNKLRSGYNATVEIGISQTPSLLVPLMAIRHTGDKTIVFVVEDGLAVEREVTTGDDDGVNVEIEAGLQAGDEVISQLTDDIAAGKKVKVE